MAIALFTAQESSFSSVFVWLLVLVAAVIGGFWVVTWLKRWLKTDEEPVSIGFSLSDLRDLHRAGKLSDEEFERARAKMAASMKRDLSKPPRPAAGEEKQSGRRPS